MLFGVCIYARKWRIFEDEQLKDQILSNEIQPQKENDKLCINLHARNELKKRNPDFWAWIYWQNGIVAQPVVNDRGENECLYQNLDGKPSVCGAPMIFETKSENKIIYGQHV